MTNGSSLISVATPLTTGISVKRKILFIHNGGRFRFIAEAFASREWEYVLIGPPEEKDLPGARTLRYQLGRGSTVGIFHAAQTTEVGLVRGHHTAEVALQLKSEGFVPDLIIGHPDWGEMVF